MDFGREVDTVNLRETGKKRYVQRILSLAAGVLLDHLAKTDGHIFIAFYDLLHIEGQIGAVIRILVHVLLRLVQFFLRCVFRRDEDVDQFIHQIPVLILMLHGEHVKLIVYGIGQLAWIDLQRIVHEHLVIFPVGPFILGNYKLILIFSEVQPADDAVQFVPALVGFPDGASYLKDKVILKMFHRLARLFFRRLPVRFQIVALQRVQQFIVSLVILNCRGVGTVWIIPQVFASDIHQFLVCLLLPFLLRTALCNPLPLQIFIIG